MLAEDERNSVYRKRVLYLIPFNFLAIFATIKYFQNIQKIAKRFWPGKQKATVMNFFLVGTAQAICLTTFYVGGSLALLGINPIQVIRNNKKLFEEDEEQDLSTDE